ncbi:hypothetical protein ALP54_04129 [Pseudomonas amygdali pv. lachrymans]|nr:hypothetical protein ALP54_04129 [Pseudomonas amygdali pv. lachrymans]
MSSVNLLLSPCFSGQSWRISNLQKQIENPHWASLGQSGDQGLVVIIFFNAIVQDCAAKQIVIVKSVGAENLDQHEGVFDIGTFPT